MILLALLKMKIDRNRKKVHLHPSVSISMFGFERVQFRVGAVASLYSTAGWILYRICRRTRFHNPGCHYLVQGFILPPSGIIIFRCITYICCICKCHCLICCHPCTKSLGESRQPNLTAQAMLPSSISSIPYLYLNPSSHSLSL